MATINIAQPKPMVMADLKGKVDPDWCPGCGDFGVLAAVQKALEKADFKSVRGAFKFGNNHFPIQNFYLQDVVKDAKGDYVLKTVATIVKDYQDASHSKCPMK